MFGPLAGALIVPLILVQIRMLHFAYRQLGVNSGAAFVLLCASLLGSYVNIPIAALGQETMVTAGEVTYFGMRYIVPVMPGAISWALPSLSRCMTRPSNRYVTVARPICGWGRTSMPCPAMKLHRIHLIGQRFARTLGGIRHRGRKGIRPGQGTDGPDQPRPVAAEVTPGSAPAATAVFQNRISRPNPTPWLQKSVVMCVGCGWKGWTPP